MTISKEEFVELWANKVRELIIPAETNYVELFATINQKEYSFVYQWNVFLSKFPHLLKIKVNDNITTNWMILHNCFFAISEGYRNVYDLAIFLLSDNDKELGSGRNDISNTHHLYYCDWDTYDKLIQYFFKQQ